MRPLFTIDAGEYLVGLYIQKSLKLSVWIPAKDVGIDLLVTGSDNLRAVSLQVKYGKDFLPEKKVELRKKLRCISWFTLNPTKLARSQAQFWVFVLRGFESDVSDFVVVPTAKLQQRVTELHSGEDHFQIYLCSGNGFCWETRGLGDDMRQMENGVRKEPLRNFTKYLNERGWAAVTDKLRV
jgi:hypothetical protein